MPPELIDFINNYGYLAIFLVIFAQEIGMPIPVPNEIVLLFIGYLSLNGILYLPFVIMVAIFADFMGASALYLLFYFFGTYLLKHKPRWLHLPQNRINSVSERITKKGHVAIYFCRFTPFVRGIVSIITGMMHMKPRKYLPITFITAAIWSTIFVIAGRMLGPYFKYEEYNAGNLHFVILISVIIIILIAGIILHIRKRPKMREPSL
jgi:membrane protein DedA with SNARE-associated domain